MPRRDGNGRRSKTVCEKTRFALDKLDDNENAFDKTFIVASSSNRPIGPTVLILFIIMLHSSRQVDT